LQFDEVAPASSGLLLLLWVVQGDMCSQENGAGDCMEMRLPTSYMGNRGKYHPDCFG